jgi:hypothetical protein
LAIPARHVTEDVLGGPPLTSKLYKV